MVVGFDVDACLSDAQTGVDDLVSGVGNLNVASENTRDIAAKPSPTFPSLDIIHAGAYVPQKALVELTTRSEWSLETLPWSDLLAQLYLAATPRVYIGVHKRGTVVEIQQHDLEEETLTRLLHGNAENFEKLGRILEVLQGLVVERGKDAKLSLVCKGGTVSVHERTDKSDRLPASILARFDAE